MEVCKSERLRRSALFGGQEDGIALIEPALSLHEPGVPLRSVRLLWPLRTLLCTLWSVLGPLRYLPADVLSMLRMLPVLRAAVS
ncbi:hypothetical protein EVAR_15924_1 [Eumeta japonica]|uniref:Uncharacterized protein n=1 Tax=Eumeta variegata TaxID=151549 RepID=A0A4C1UL22_EUMVA|nr:hypothetical protein EVAR_15924_1 [Eumeta japonica]